MFTPLRKLQIGAAALALAGGLGGLVAGARPCPANRALDPERLDALLEPVRRRHGLPALAGAIVAGDELVGLGVVGERKLGSQVPVERGDLWHLGSCTKAMTATLCAILVERGDLSWDATVGEAFGDLEGLDPGYRDVTLIQLLSNRGGAPKELEMDDLWKRLVASQDPPQEQRRLLVETVLRHPPVTEPGGKYVYSNAGFTIAGAMAERAAGESWEELMRKELFQPLGMASAGFGAPGEGSALDQPWGHWKRPSGLEPVAPEGASDNPPAIGPAGTVHASMADWARFISLHLRDEDDAGADAGAEGEAPLGPAGVRRLHDTSPFRGYAFGWRHQERDWAGGEALSHTGSNQRWTCVAWLAPERDFAVLVACNAGQTDGALDKAASILIQHHLARQR